LLRHKHPWKGKTPLGDRFLTSGRRKGLETHIKRIAAKGISTDFGCKVWWRAFLECKAAFRDKYTLFFEDWSRVFGKKGSKLANSPLLAGCQRS
jgi:hypothetical protein